MTAARSRALLAAHAALALPLVAACAGADGADRSAVTDSAGVTLVTSPGSDRILQVRYVAEVTLGGGESETESFYRVSRFNVATDASGRIHVLDADNHRVLVFGSDGRHLRTLGRKGEGPGELQWPASLIVAPDGTVMVHDIGKQALVTWDPSGEPTTDSEPPSRFTAGGIAHTADGVVTVQGSVAGGSGQRLVRVSPAGDTVELARAAPVDLRTVQFESCGIGIGGLPPLFYPGLRWTAGGGRVAAAVDAGYVVDLFEGGERVVSVRRTVPPRPATPELALLEVGEGMRIRTSEGERVCDPDEVVEQRGFLDVVPAVAEVMLSRDGELWVTRSGVGEDEARRVDLFDVEGVYRGTLPEGMTAPVAFLPDGRIVWAERDALDVERMMIGSMVTREDGA